MKKLILLGCIMSTWLCASPIGELDEVLKAINFFGEYGKNPTETTKFLLAEIRKHSNNPRLNKLADVIEKCSGLQEKDLAMGKRMNNPKGIEQECYDAQANFCTYLAEAELDLSNELK